MTYEQLHEDADQGEVTVTWEPTTVVLPAHDDVTQPARRPPAVSVHFTFVASAYAAGSTTEDREIGVLGGAPFAVRAVVDGTVYLMMVLMGRVALAVIPPLAEAVATALLHLGGLA